MPSANKMLLEGIPAHMDFKGQQVFRDVELRL